MLRFFQKKAAAAANKPAISGGAGFLPELTLEHLFLQQRYQNQIGINPQTKTGSNIAGRHLSYRQGRGMELSEIRHYQPGDDIRLMDWKVTARTRRPHTKVFLEERERPVQLIVDLSDAMLFGSIRSKAEQAATAAATLGWALSAQGERCGGVVFNNSTSHFIKPRAKHKGLLPLLESCCHLGHMLNTPSGGTVPDRMNQILQQLAQKPGHGSLIIIISDFWSLNLSNPEPLQRLTQHHDVVALQITDPLEYELPPALCSLTDGQNDVDFDGGRPTEQERFRKYFNERQKALEQNIHRARGRFITLSTQESPADKLKQYFVKKSR